MKLLCILVCFIECDSSFFLLCSLLSSIVVHYTRDHSCVYMCTCISWSCSWVQLPCVDLSLRLIIHVQMNSSMYMYSICLLQCTSHPGLRAVHSLGSCGSRFIHVQFNSVNETRQCKATTPEDTCNSLFLKRKRRTASGEIPCTCTYMYVQCT